MLLEDASSRSLSSVDFGRAAQQAMTTPRGIALPPPTEFIQAPAEILDEEAALLEADKAKQSLFWRARLKLRRVSAIARELASRTLELLPKPSEEEELPEVEISQDIDLDDADQADTAPGVPAPVPSKALMPKERGKSEWEVTTQVVDMTRRRKPGSRPGSLIPVNDLVLDRKR